MVGFSTMSRNKEIGVQIDINKPYTCPETGLLLSPHVTFSPQPRGADMEAAQILRQFTSLPSCKDAIFLYVCLCQSCDNVSACSSEKRAGVTPAVTEETSGRDVSAPKSQLTRQTRLICARRT